MVLRQQLNMMLRVVANHQQVTRLLVVVRVYIFLLLHRSELLHEVHEDYSSRVVVTSVSVQLIQTLNSNLTQEQVVYLVSALHNFYLHLQEVQTIQVFSVSTQQVMSV